jgi:hypothetical protein
MATPRQIAANRLNARKSTGPRSRSGKTRSRNNAMRHGLTLSVDSDPASRQQIAEYARDVAASGVTLEHANAIAEAQFDVLRVLQAKIKFIEEIRATGALDHPSLEPDHDTAPTVAPERPRRTLGPIGPVLSGLLKLDRYEQRARARRNRAVKRLIAERSVR